MVIDAETIKHQENMAQLQQALNSQPAYAIVEQAPDRSSSLIDLDNPVIITGANDNASAADENTVLLAHNNHNNRYRYRGYGHDHGFTACITIDFITICDGDDYRRGRGHGHGHDPYWDFRYHDHHWNDNKRHRNNKNWKRKNRKKHKNRHRHGGGKNHRHGSILGDQFEGQVGEGQVTEALAKNTDAKNLETKAKEGTLSGVMTLAAINPNDITTKVSFNSSEPIKVDASDFTLTDFVFDDHHDNAEPEENLAIA